MVSQQFGSTGVAFRLDLASGVQMGRPVGVEDCRNSVMGFAVYTLHEKPGQCSTAAAPRPPQHAAAPRFFEVVLAALNGTISTSSGRHRRLRANVEVGKRGHHQQRARHTSGCKGRMAAVEAIPLVDFRGSLTHGSKTWSSVSVA